MMFRKNNKKAPITTGWIRVGFWLYKYRVIPSYIKDNVADPEHPLCGFRIVIDKVYGTKKQKVLAGYRMRDILMKHLKWWCSRSRNTEDWMVHVFTTKVRVIDYISGGSELVMDGHTVLLKNYVKLNGGNKK